MSDSFDLLIVGVGGQGTILASNIIGEACLIEGRSVRSAETHGMAQRGGSVETHIRIDGTYGSLVTKGSSELIISFDVLEAVRYRHYLKKDGIMVTSKNLIVPTSAFQSCLDMPSVDSLTGMLSDVNLCMVDAVSIAQDAGSILAQNIVMIGAASHYMPLSKETLIDAVTKLVPPKTVDINKKAFEMGRDAGRKK